MSKTPENVIFIGKKPVKNYVLAAIMQLGKSKEITLKARGKAISKAVDTAMIIRDRYIPGTIEIKKVTLGSETVPVQTEGGETRERNVSTIEIVLQKKQ